MSAGRFNLDHVAVVVPDLERARALYERLGFALTPRSSHRGPLPPDGPIEDWGTGNHCAMLERGYLELLGITDPGRYHEHVKRRLERYEGLHLIAFGCHGIERLVEDLNADALGISAPVSLERDVPFGEGTRLGRFAISQLDERRYPEADFLLIEHLTRDVLWQAELMSHPNGVIALHGATVCSEDPPRTRERLAELLGPASQDTFRLDGGCLRVLDPLALKERFGQPPSHPAPCGAALEFTVADPQRTRRWLEENDVAHDFVSPGCLRVSAESAGGTIIEFRAAGE